MSLDITLESDSAVKTIVIANASNSWAQRDATSASKLYSSGRLSIFCHIYKAFCNIRAYMALMVADVDASLLVQKMSKYVDLLNLEQATTLFESAANSGYMPIHTYQDLQHILSAFVTISFDSSLTKAVIDGGDVTLASYQ